MILNRLDLSIPSYHCFLNGELIKRQVHEQLSSAPQALLLVSDNHFHAGHYRVMGLIMAY